MRQLLRLQKSHSINDIERSLDELQHSRQCEILLNLQLRDWQFGGVSSLIQLLITWRKRCPRAHLVTHIQDKSRATVQLRNLAQTDHGLVALMLASDVTTASGTTSVTAEAERFVTSRLDEMREGLGSPGPERLLLCADYCNHYLPKFYYEPSDDHPEPKIKGEGQFSSLTKDSISKMIAVHYRAKPLSDEFVNALGSILYELFLNTHRWAKDEWNRMPIERSVRGIRLEIVRNTRERLLSGVQQNPPLVRYISALPRSAFGEQHMLCEVSVFDSGPGLAARWLNMPIDANLSVERERKAVLECLKKHATSESRSHHGLGLYFVMQQLTLVNGFLRIRTGRLSLYRDFQSDPFSLEREDEANENPNLDLFDWLSGSTTAGRFAPTEGTLFSMLIPIKLERR